MKLGLIVGLLALGLVAGQPICGDASAQQPAAQNKPNAPAQPEPAELSPILDRIDRIATALETANANEDREGDDKRADQDLQAQKDMAQWAFWLLLTSVVSLAIGVFGLFAVYWSLSQTRRAIQDNRISSRGNLSLDLKVASLFDDHPEARPAVHGQIANTGQSRLKEIKVSFRAEIRRIESGDKIGPDLTGSADIAVLGPNESNPSLLIAIAEQLTADQFEAIADAGSTDLLIFANWEFTDAFNDREALGPTIFWGRPGVSLHGGRKTINASLSPDIGGFHASRKKADGQ